MHLSVIWDTETFCTTKYVSVHTLNCETCRGLCKLVGNHYMKLGITQLRLCIETFLFGIYGEWGWGSGVARLIRSIKI